MFADSENARKTWQEADHTRYEKYSQIVMTLRNTERSRINQQETRQQIAEKIGALEIGCGYEKKNTEQQQNNLWSANYLEKKLANIEPVLMSSNTDANISTTNIGQLWMLQKRTD